MLSLNIGSDLSGFRAFYKHSCGSNLGLELHSCGASMGFKLDTLHVHASVFRLYENVKRTWGVRLR